MFELIKNDDTYLLRVRNAFEIISIGVFDGDERLIEVDSERITVYKELRSYSFLRGDKSKEAIEKVVLSAIA
mgnify:FL=1